MNAGHAQSTLAHGSSEIIVPPFAVIPGSQVQRALDGREKEIVELVEATYRLHGAGRTVNPPPRSSASQTAPPRG